MESERIVPTMCHGCSYGGYNCGMLAHVKDGKFVRVEGNPHHPLNKGKLCAKGQAAVQWVYNEQRLKYPLIRAGEKGEGSFKRISWEEAMSVIAEKIKETKEEYGPEYIMLSKGQSSGWAGLHQFLWIRFMHALGSTSFSNWGPSVCYAPQLMYHKQLIGGPSYARPDYEHADLIVEWFTGGGTGGAARGGVETLDTNLRSIPLKIIERVNKGARLIIINPQLIALGANGRVSRWLPVRPGTDGALALSMIHVIIRDKVYDKKFVSEWCEGFDKLSAHVKQYTPAWAEGITGIEAREIEELARDYATTPRACMRVSEAPQKQDLRSFAMAVPILMAITGHLDRPGGNAWFFPAARLGFSTLSNRISSKARERVLGGDTFYIKSSGRHSAFFRNVIEALISGKPYRPRTMLVFGSNPMSTARNPALVAEAFKKVDFTVVVDVSKTPTSRYADIVLPAATRYECYGQPGIWENHLTMSHKVIDPLWEARDELEVTLDLASRLGMGKDFWNGDHRAMVADFLKPAGVTLEQLEQSALEGIYLPRTEWMDRRERYEELFKELPDGKIQLYNTVLEKEGFEPLPTYVGETEDPLSAPELSNEYPLMFTDEHSAYINHHSWMRDIPWLREIRKHAFVKINPATAKKYGIDDGDWVDIVSPHGRMKAVAILFEAIRPDTLMSQHGWWQGCDALDLKETPPLQEGTNPNVLYDWDNRDLITGDITKNTMVRIQRGAPPEEVLPVREGL
ncbi:MAG: molybdopterin-dependent oxidoreductase [Deltaproteobacteria bacterium]|nr:molybdopterin-dependent oxidoreductase [Deltaproteobacteria bacterium]